MKALIGLGLVSCALLNAGCTFYTGCPTAQQNTAGTSSSGGGGGSSAGSGGGPTTPGDPLIPTGEAIALSSDWQDATGSLEGESTACGNVMYLAAKPKSDKMIAGVVQHGLWESSDGSTWNQLGTKDGSAVINNVPQSIIFDPENSDIFWEAGIYFDGGVYRTDDGGGSFLQLGQMGHNTTVSVDFSDPDRQTLLAAGHEMAGKLLLSKDGGTTWTDIGGNLPKDMAYCDNVQVVDTNDFLVGCDTFSNARVGIARSADGGDSWDLVSETGGFRQPLLVLDGTMYWVGLATVSMVKSTDSGKSWTKVGAGPFRAQPLELPDGRIAAMGVKTLLISDDAGEVWHPLGPEFPKDFTIEFFAYSPEQRAFYAGGGTCNMTIKAGTIKRLDFDYEMK